MDQPLRMMMGEVDEVIGVAGRHVPRMESESWSRMLMKFENGTVGVLTARMLCTHPGRRICFGSPVQRESFKSQVAEMDSYSCLIKSIRVGKSS